MKKWFKILLCIIIPVVLLRSFSLITDSFDDEETNTPFQTETTNSSNGLPTVKETVVCDDQTAKIVVSGLSENRSIDSCVVNINIANKLDKAITYNVKWAKVNSFAMGSLPWGCIYAGMNADADYYFSMDDVRLAQISSITVISFSIEICDKETNETLSVTTAELHTSAYGKDSSSFSFDGTKVYSADGVSIYMKPSANATINSPLLVFVENNTEHQISINYVNLAINDKMVAEMTTGPFIPANSKSVSKMQLHFFDNEPGIEAVESVTLSLSILPFNSDGGFSTAAIIETEPFTIEIQ